MSNISFSVFVSFNWCSKFSCLVLTTFFWLRPASGNRRAQRLPCCGGHLPGVFCMGSPHHPDAHGKPARPSEPQLLCPCPCSPAGFTCSCQNVRSPCLTHVFILGGTNSCGPGLWRCYSTTGLFGNLIGWGVGARVEWPGLMRTWVLLRSLMGQTADHDVFTSFSLSHQTETR